MSPSVDQLAAQMLERALLSAAPEAEVTLTQLGGDVIVRIGLNGCQMRLRPSYYSDVVDVPERMAFYAERVVEKLRDEAQ